MDMATSRLIEPRLSTPPVEDRSGGHTLPETVLNEQVQRVGVATGVAAGLWTFGLVMDGLIRPWAFHVHTPGSTLVIECVSILMAALTFSVMRLVSTGQRTKIQIGLAFFVLNALAVALLNSWATAPALSAKELSWTTIVVLVSSMILPATPRTMLVVALVAASTDPLVVWIDHLRGMHVPGIVQTLVLFAPNYACALVATLPSRALARFGRRLRQAQAMGSYHLVERLGRGGMGEVWRAHHRLLARSAAIKLVRPELIGAANDVEAQLMLRRFEREAQATAALSSPHTIRVFDYGVTEDKTFYYAMELLDGRDIESLVRNFGPLPPARALFLLRQACHSLADAHARGMIHRDVTPSNIYVCAMGLDFDFVKVLDFGLVTYQARPAARQTLVNGEEVTMGTPAFMAPEILDGEVDARSDVYALGCVAYYMLTGELVFDGDTPIKMFIHHLQTPPMPLSERTEMPVPRDVERLVLACLEKDPARRPQNASELMRLIDSCRCRSDWDNDAAREWWMLHLKEFAGTSAVDASQMETLATAVA
jgi:serine/threonine-protein kinase